MTTAEIEEDALTMLRELIRIDSSNFGDDSGPGEGEAAAYVVERLREVSLEPVVIDSKPGRPNIFVRVPGADAGRGLVVHGHLDVVPADASEWSVDPFGAVEKDGMIWGRGAVDMKNMVAMMLAVLRNMAHEQIIPPRDLLFAFFADEEAGGTWGAHWIADNRPEIFDGYTEAISEVGGYSVTLKDTKTADDKRVYLLQTAEKGMYWGTVTAKGKPGHGSLPNDDNAIIHLAQAIERIGAYEWPLEYVATVRTLLSTVADVTGREWDESEPTELVDQLGGARRFVAGTLRDSINFSQLNAGYKVNVVPGTAQASFDCRFLPGHEQALRDKLQELAGPDVEFGDIVVAPSIESPSAGPLIDAMAAALDAEDPGAQLVPYCLSAGTDNKWLSQLGIAGYGFVPMRLPADFEFADMFHGIDERVPVESVRFGVRVLKNLLENC